MMPGTWPAFLVEPRLEQVVVIGAIDVVLGIFLARPNDLHRPIHLLGDAHGLDHAVDIQAPAEAAAEILVVNPDFVLRQAGNLAGRGLGASRDLRTDPDITAVLANVHGAI